MDKKELIDILKKELKVTVTVTKKWSTYHDVTTIVTLGEEVISKEVNECSIGYI